MKNYLLLFSGVVIATLLTGCGSSSDGDLDTSGTNGNISINSNEGAIPKKSPTLAKSQSLTIEEQCEPEYQKIIDKHGKEFNDCMGTVDDAYYCDKKKKKTNLVLIMDASGSMARTIKGQSRMEIAKSAASEFIGNLKNDINFGMIVYGHKGSTAEKAVSCSGIDVFTPLGTGNRGEANQVISNLKPVGWTPIADSLSKARSVLVSHAGSESNNTVLLVSDGKETCDGSPDSVAASLAQKDNITVNVIGFDVVGETENQLKSVAENGNGQYYSARTTNELSAALKNLTKVTCASAPNAWSEGFDSVLTSYLDCGFRLDAEALDISQSASFDLKKEQCEAYVTNKYEKREKSLRAMIEVANEAGEKRLQNVNPNSGDSFFNQEMSDEMGDEEDDDEDMWDDDF